MQSSGFLPRRDVAQPGRALAWGARGRQFKSARPDQFKSSAVFLLLSACRFQKPDGPRAGFPLLWRSSSLYTELAMLEKLMQPTTEEGRLIFESRQTTTVNYWAEKDASGRWHGQVSHAEGHPDWHPVVALHPGPFTLVMGDGRRLKVFLESLKGFFHGTEDQES